MMTNGCRGIALLTMIVSLFVTGCGGGGGSSAPATAVGQFVDAPVAGMAYESGSQKGVTDANGQFVYEQGKKVIFRIGDIVLGEAQGEAIITPLHLVGPGADASTPEVIKRVQLLLSLSTTDPAATGRITLPGDLSPYRNKSLNFATATDADLQRVLGTVPATTATASAHITTSLKRLFTGSHTGTWSATAGSPPLGTWDATVDENGAVTGTRYRYQDRSVMPITGAVALRLDTGGFVFTADTGDGIHWTGVVDPASGTVKGRWQNGTSSGPFTTEEPAAGSDACSDAAQKSWVRGHLDDVYLWYNEITEVDPSSYTYASDYFDALLVASRDRFSFSMPEKEAQRTFMEGRETGWGIRWGRSSSGQLYVLYVDPNSVAAAQSVTRGMEAVTINGSTVQTMSVADLNRVLESSVPGATATVRFRLRTEISLISVALVSREYDITTVGQPKIVTLADGRKAGYLLFNEHLPTAEPLLVNAMAFFKQQRISELVLDMRYNPGGYLVIADEVASMIGGAAVQGKVFESLRFNDRHLDRMNQPGNVYHFRTVDSTGTSLPQLGLSRLFVLTGSGTCSASEAVINGLMPHLPVIRIGSTTCGKPYASRQANYCGQSYFALETGAVNADGLADYQNGFYPTCQVSDYIDYQLGDMAENRLSAATYYMTYGYCPPGTSTAKKATVIEDLQPVASKPPLNLVDGF